MNNISYQAIGEASELHSKFGYKRIEVPWWATSDIMNLTKPKGAKNYTIQNNNKHLLASGEQGFLYLANKGQLPAGKYQTVTPCFREEAYDQYHSKQFMKLELIELLPERPRDSKYNSLLVKRIAAQAKNVFAKLIEARGYTFANKLEIIETFNLDRLKIVDQLDVVLNIRDKQIELGSYGMRTASFATWVFGTGIAEPRFSKAINEFMNY